MDVQKITIKDAHKSLQNKEYSARELTQTFLDHTHKTEPKIKAFLNVTDDKALKTADKVDKDIAAGKKIPLLAGIPVGIKDCFCTKGIVSTSGSKILENYVPPFDATAVACLKEQDAVIIGKTNTDEFTMGASGENSAFYPTHNPWNTDYVPGGSSAGSAAAVAASQCVYALGTDTGGSIRQPAAFCGITGLKPTYGRISRYGAMSMASSCDTIGHLAKNAYDAALLLEVLAGPDGKDSTAEHKAGEKYTKKLTGDIKGKTIGLPKEYFIDGMDKDVAENVRKAAEQLEKLGANIVEVSLPHTEYALAVYYIIAPAEVSSNMSRYDGVRYGMVDKTGKDLFETYTKTRGKGFGDEVKRRIMIGTYVLSEGYHDAYYKKAQIVRTKIVEDFTNVFKKVDALLTPTTPTPAFKLGEKLKDPLAMYLADIFTVSVSVAGVCSVSVPCGFVERDHVQLPCGMQLVGKQFAEAEILNIAHAYQGETSWHMQYPKL